MLGGVANSQGGAVVFPSPDKIKMAGTVCHLCCNSPRHAVYAQARRHKIDFREDEDVSDICTRVVLKILNCIGQQETIVDQGGQTLLAVLELLTSTRPKELQFLYPDDVGKLSQTKGIEMKVALLKVTTYCATDLECLAN